MKRIYLTIITLLLAVSFDAAALPKIPANQVSVDPTSIGASTGTTVQAVLEDFDNAMPVNATTNAFGIIKIATAADVTAGTDTTKAVTPAQLHTQTVLPTPQVITSYTNKTTVYQNTSARYMFVNIIGQNSYWMGHDSYAWIGETSNPTTMVSHIEQGGDIHTKSVTLTFIVPPGWYFKYSIGGDQIPVCAAILF
jgi:hypothetical protein